jgi:predicted metal-binding protein
LPADGVPPGQDVFDAVAEALAEQPGAAELHPVVCLAACARGCAAVISMPGKWSYLLGGLTPEMAGDLLTYAAAYGASKSGVLMPSRRPPSLAGAVLARIPDLEPVS